jgi:ankyrin
VIEACVLPSSVIASNVISKYMQWYISTVVRPSHILTQQRDLKVHAVRGISVLSSGHLTSSHAHSVHCSICLRALPCPCPTQVNASLNAGGDTLLHLACRSGAGERVVAALVAAGAGIELENAVGHRALHEAALASSPSTVEGLVRCGAHVDALKHAGWTPLMLAASKPSGSAADTVCALLDAGARHALRNKDGWTALHVAARAGDVETVKRLLEADTEQDNREGTASPSYGTPSERGCSSATTSADSSSTLTPCPTTRHVSNNGRTVLMTAALHGHTGVLKVLLDDPHGVGGSVSDVNSCGQTALHWAVIGGSVSAVAALLAAGASIDAVDAKLSNVLHLAAAAGDGSEYFNTTIAEAVANLDQLLDELEKRRTLSKVVNAPDRLGLTSLHHAAIAGHSWAVDTLLSRGSDATLTDAHGRTAAFYARQSGHVALADFIDAALAL